MKNWIEDRIGALLSRFLEQGRKAAENSDAEQVHDLRTSIRRLRESLRVFGDFYSRKRVRPLRKSLQGLMKLAAEVRNRDIAVELIESSGVAGMKLRRSFETERTDFAQRLVAQLQAEVTDQAAADWQAVLASPKRKPSSSQWKPKESVEQNMAAVLPKVGKGYWKAGRKLRTKHLDFETLHRFRLKTKRYRYTLELFRDINAEPPVDSELERLKPVQDLLGNINDCATALNLIGGRSGKHPRFAQYLHERAAKKTSKLGDVLDRSA